MLKMLYFSLLSFHFHRLKLFLEFSLVLCSLLYLFHCLLQVADYSQEPMQRLSVFTLTPKFSDYSKQSLGSFYQNLMQISNWKNTDISWTGGTGLEYIGRGEIWFLPEWSEMLVVQARTIPLEHLWCLAIKIIGPIYSCMLEWILFNSASLLLGPNTDTMYNEILFDYQYPVHQSLCLFALGFLNPLRSLSVDRWNLRRRKKTSTSGALAIFAIPCRDGWWLQIPFGPLHRQNLYAFGWSIRQAANWLADCITMSPHLHTPTWPSENTAAAE